MLKKKKNLSLCLSKAVWHIALAHCNLMTGKPMFYLHLYSAPVLHLHTHIRTKSNSRVPEALGGAFTQAKAF